MRSQLQPKNQLAASTGVVSRSQTILGKQTMDHKLLALHSLTDRINPRSIFARPSSCAIDT